jgi:ABC-type glycerol-3-phosphate transport system substrate-binding protein
MAMSTALAAARNKGGSSGTAGMVLGEMMGGNTNMSNIGKALQAARSRKGQRNTNDSGESWKSSVDERLVALEQGGDASSQSVPDIGAAPVPEDIGGAASTITGGGVANMATQSNFSPDAKIAAEGMFGTDADRAASVQGKPNVLESPQVSASAELGALFEKPETSYSAIGG